MKRQLSILLALVLMPLFVAAAETERANGSDTCHRSMIRGSYAYYGGGTMGTQPFKTIGTAWFDGQGSFTWTSSDFPGGTMSGTYTLSPDCTGTSVHNFPAGFGIPPGSGKLVVAAGGNEIYIVADAPAPMTPATSLFIYKRIVGRNGQ